MGIESVKVSGGDASWVDQIVNVDVWMVGMVCDCKSDFVDASSVDAMVIVIVIVNESAMVGEVMIHGIDQ